jgi:two-component system cell cycle sensor histidine kinase/response regulator CckA
MRSPAFEPLSVLVIEDDNQLLRTLGDILRLHGHSPLTAASGREGLDLVAHRIEPLAVALVDLKLPDMDGVEVVGRLRSISSLTETVILTGHASVDSAIRALRQHTGDYLVKPIAPDLLLTTIERAGERWQRRQAEEALRRSEERSQLLLENISDLVVVVDAALTIRYVSPSVVRMLRYSPEELVGHSFLDIAHPDDARIVEQFLRLTARREESTWQELRVRYRDGEWRLLEMTGANLVGQTQMKGLVLTGRDVTERRRLEIQLRQAQKMESIGRLAGGVAHDFNNILSVVIGYSELALARPAIEDDLRREIDEVRKAGERASQLTRQLLTFARRQPSQIQVFSLNDVVDDLSEMLGPLLGETIVLRTELAPSLGPIRTDPAQIEQVIVNLVLNARDAMPQGGNLLIRTVNLFEGTSDRPDGAPAGDHVVLIVSDTGVGMTDDVRSRVFEPFFTTKEASRGTGLGLAMVYGILQSGGGSIGIESEVGKGTTFRLYWPRVDDPIEPLPVQDSSDDIPTGTETVLVVDDERVIREFLMKALEAQGYSVITVSDAVEALAVLRSGAPTVDLLLTDVVLSGMTGDELAVVVAQEQPQVPVVLMSGYEEGAALPADPAGPPRRVLQKPFTLAVLARRIRSALDA